MMETSEMKKFGSQGQRKTMVIAMWLAHWDLVSANKGFRPILLLDDIFDKLDDHRIGRLLDLMRDAFGQLFVTDARPDRTAGLLRNVNADVSVYTVDRRSEERRVGKEWGDRRWQNRAEHDEAV